MLDPQTIVVFYFQNITQSFLVYSIKQKLICFKGNVYVCSIEQNSFWLKRGKNRKSINKDITAMKPLMIIVYVAMDRKNNLSTNY